MKILNSFLNFYNFVISIIIIIYGFCKKSFFLVKIADAKNELKASKKCIGEIILILTLTVIGGYSEKFSNCLHEIRSIQDLYIK
jgi:hypothetical protein